jgi:hypothetical protein
MMEFTEMHKLFARARGKENRCESTRKHIRRHIHAEFGSALEIFPDNKGKLLVIPGNFSLKEIVKTHVTMKKELDILRSHSLDIQKIIDQSSMYIRKSILDMKWKTSWPIHPSDLDIQSFSVPEYLNGFLLGLLTTDVAHPSKRVKNFVSSFSQDIVYAATCGQTKPPKQVLISYGVKTLTGYVELMQILNRFGHGISYSQLEENDTALSLENMASNLNQSPIIPRATQPNLFTNLAWDNIDRLEETLTGKGTALM